MRSSLVETREALATDVEVSDDTLVVDLADGRTISVPLAWYPRLAHATAAERKSWRLIGGGVGIHWPGIDESACWPTLDGKPKLVEEVARQPCETTRGRKRSGENLLAT